MQALEHGDVEARLRALVAESPDAAVYCVDPFGAQFVEIPTAARDLFRWSLSANTPIELMATDHRIRGAELFVICRKTGASQGTVRLADAPDTDVDLHLFNGGDWVIGVAITAPVEDDGGAAVIHRNRVGRIVDVDAAALRMLKRSRTQLLGARLDDFSHPDDVDLCLNGWKAIVADSDGVQHLRSRLRADDGSIVWVEQYDKNALSTPLGVVITELADVTETVLVQQREAFHAALTDQLADDATAMAYLRQDRTVDYSNARWSELTGLLPDAPFYEFVAAVREPETVEAAITRTFGYGRPGDTPLTLRSHPRAPERRIRMQTRLLEGPDGSPGVVIALDEVPQVRINADGETRAGRGDRGLGESAGVERQHLDARDSHLSAPATPASALSEGDRLEAPTPPPAPAPTPLAGGRRAADPPEVEAQAASVSSASTAVEAREQRPNAEAAWRAAAEKARQPGVSADKDAGSYASTEPDEDVPKPSRLAALLGLLSALAVAALTRLWQLDSLVDGTLEVERWNAAVATRIAGGESVGAYARNGFDQPTGGLNTFAVAGRLSLDSAVDLRWVSATAGCLGVAALYWAVRRWVGALEGAAAAMALALMVWHIHFSRFAIGEVFWPLLLTVGVGLLARPRPRLTSWLIAGAAFGATVWFSNAAWLALGGILVVLLFWTLGGRRRARLDVGPAAGGSLVRVLAAVGAAGAVSLPVALEWFGNERNDRFFGGFDRDLEGGFWNQVGDATASWASTWVDLVASPQSNPLDASGIALPVGWVLALLAGVGLIILLVRDRSLPTWIVLALVLSIPFGPALAADGSVRHALGLAPLLALLAGIAAAWVVRTISLGSGRAGRLLGVAVVLLLLGLVGWSTYAEYFDSFPESVELLGILGS